MISHVVEKTMAQQCPSEKSISGRMLKGHVYKTMSADIGLPCWLVCRTDGRCQSFNFVISSRMCELNNRTKEAKPKDFIPDPDRYYFRKPVNRVPLGSIPELAAESCKEIKMSEEETTSRKYWLSSIRPGIPLFAFCNMTTEDINECTASPPVCHVSSQCTNTLGSFRCVCKHGFTYDGKRCSDINECNASSPVCHVSAHCSNTFGSYRCICNPGYTYDGKRCTVPYPSAWFPLNNTHEIEEIERRTTPGIKGDKVYLSLGPDGTQDGSYFFRGPHANSINFSDRKLDIGFPITIVCWLYTYDNNAKTEGFLQYKGIHLSANHKELKLSSSSSDQLLTGTLAEKGWTFVGVSYNKTTAEVKLWIDGNVVNSTTLIADFDSNEPQLLKLGGNNFKGKITQLMLFNLTLTQEQMQGTKGRMKLPAMIFNSAIISSNSFYSAELASFLAPVVGQMESKWKRCHSALANGWDHTAFHANCDNKKHTVTIIEKKPYIFGGYTDIPWESPVTGSWGNTLKAFIFSLSNSKALPPFKCLAKDKDGAIYLNSNEGPSFGQSPSLFITSPASMSEAGIGIPYKVPKEVNKVDPREVLANTKSNFHPDNYEVFYLA
ncbi:uncharacterized protein [Acropora muricata]|uniref:uncharacterized protein n=1 Tax=Acropora muricata TaxID=159855 RepID=UPI0034E4F8E6